MNETTISSRSEKRLIWSVYWMDERFTTSNLTNQIAADLKSVLFGHEASALVAFSAPMDGTLEDAQDRIRAAVVSRDLPGNLNTADGIQSEPEPKSTASEKRHVRHSGWFDTDGERPA